MKTLLIYKDNWADEIDIEAFHILDNELENIWNDINKFTKQQMKNSDSISISIGSNESIEYENAYELLNHIKVYTINNDEYEIFKKYFKKFNNEIYSFKSLRYILENILEVLEERE